MKIRLGVMGSAASDSARLETGNTLVDKAERLARVIAGKDVILLTGGTTGIVYVVGKTAHEAGSFHVGISPGSNGREHSELYKLPVDACDALIYTGFGLKGRNVVLVRSCDIVLFVSGAMGSMSEPNVIARHISQPISADDIDNEIWQQCQPIQIEHYWSGEPAMASRHAEARI